MADLPAHLVRCARRFGLRLQPPLPGLSYNYVAPAWTVTGEEVILKTGFPDPELATEAAFLEVAPGAQTVRLLDWDETLGAMVLERIQPGTSLLAVQRQGDAAATEAALSCLRSCMLRDPSPVTPRRFPAVAHWTRVFEETERALGTSRPEVRDLLHSARRCFDHLEAESRGPWLLHGDLHHGNILLDHTRGWVAIDPKGVVGDRAYQCARFLNNPDLTSLPRSTLLDWTRVRVEILAKGFEESPRRLLGYAFVDCILGTCWSFQGREEQWVIPEMAGVLNQLLEGSH